MADRSSRPHRTPAPVVRRIVHLRWTQRLGPAQIAPQVGLAPSTVHAILVRCRISRLAHLDRATGQPIRRYEHDHPGQLVHIDVKKLGNIPAGGGHRLLGRATGTRNSQADRSSGRISRHRNPLHGHGFIHAAVDDHSRLAYAEIHPDETRETAAGFLVRAQAWFAAHGVLIQRVLTDNAMSDEVRLMRADVRRNRVRVLEAAEAVIGERVRRLQAEARDLLDADDPGAAFFAFFSRVVEVSMRNKAVADVLADAGIDSKSRIGQHIDADMPRVIEELLTRAQRACSVRGDLGMPELRALLGAASMAAERHQWDQQLRTRDAGHAVRRAAPAPLGCP